MTEYFVRSDWTLFRSLETIGQKAGVPTRMLPLLVVKELADNALDAGSNVEISCKSGLVVVEDDGKGLPDGNDGAAVADLFSIARPLSSTKMLRLPSRGALGNGLRVVAGTVFASHGTLTVETRGMRHFLTPQNDGSTTVKSEACPTRVRGTRIEMTFGDHLPIEGDECLIWANLAKAFAGHGKTYTGKTSPHWYSLDAFHELCLAAGERPLREIIGLFRDVDPKTAAQFVPDNMAGLAGADISRETASALLNDLRNVSKPVEPTALGMLTREAMPNWAYCKKTGFVDINSRPIPTHLPYVIEAFAVPIDDPEDNIQVLVNRTPITADMRFQRGQKKSQIAIFGAGLRHLFDVGRATISVCVNITTPYMPITTDGKEPDLCRYLTPLMDAIEGAARRSRRLVPSGGKSQSQKTIILEHIEEAVTKASGNGEYRYSLRQLFYAVRPHMLEAIGKEPGYDYFASVITEFEAVYGDLPGLYRDPRGILYHPHTGEEIPLGTLAVENYRPPAWTFNKVLYSEKEGFFSILKDVQWPEINDCALLTSKGFASRAARDVIDLIGASQEEIYFFCIHDADASGTLIYQALTEATRARPGRKVHIINLGLDPEEALDMNLQVEEFRTNIRRRLPVASYISPDWAEWLQTCRVELNAMSTPRFLAWLDGKMRDYAGKVVPPTPILRQTLESETRKAVEDVLAARILEDNGFERQVEEAMRDLDLGIKTADLDKMVKQDLDTHPANRWTAPLTDHAKRLAGEKRSSSK